MMRILFILFVMIFFVVFLTACRAAPKVVDPIITLTPNPASTTIVLPSKTVTSTLLPTLTPSVTITPTVAITPTPVIFAGAGDIAICGQEGDDLTAALLRTIAPHAVFTAGDNSNEDGTLVQYQNCFEASWGQFMDIIHPVPGNHDYYSDPLQNYYAYFGEIAGPAGLGYYSYDLGDWHIIALNSNCGYLGCGPSSDQVAWLKQDLTDNPAACTLAIWHHPLFSSGLTRGAPWMQSFWDVLYPAGVDVVINGHDHIYERTGKVDPKGLPDQERGIREFIVGTGGAGHYNLDQKFIFSEKQIIREFGVLKLTLASGSYEWSFINTEGVELDAGVDTCSP
jgi:hypothetical protein